MSSSFYGINSPKQRRGSPGESQTVNFAMGQGVPVVLPSLCDAFPTSRFPAPSNDYTPRSSPARYEFNYNWPSNLATESYFSHFETNDRYCNNNLYNYQVRTPATSANNLDSRKLPPLSTTPSNYSFVSQPSCYQNASAGVVRSPTASYPPEYSYPTAACSYNYLSTQDSDLPSYVGSEYTQNEFQRPPSPSARSSSQTNSGPPTAPPESPQEEPSTAKRKRKRADAYQLKVLNEVYSKTAFPSTEQRQALAKQLDMPARSVQIWFQNKRQSNRQAQRQTAASQSSILMHRDPMLESPSTAYPLIPVTETPYPTDRSSEALSRTLASQPPSGFRRGRHHENDHRRYI